MDVDCHPDQGSNTLGAAPTHGATLLERQLSVPHVCCHTCVVTREVANMFRCHTSGQVHICDNTCQQRVYVDRYSTMCRVSRRVFHSAPLPTPSRKRGCSLEGGEDARTKRQQVLHVEAMLAM